MDRTYLSYGLRLLASGEIPGLAPCILSGPADVRVWLNEMPAGALSGERAPWYQSGLNAQGRPTLVISRTVPEGAFHLVYDGRTEFLIRPDGSEVWCAWPAAATVADAVVHLHGSVLGLVLRLRGVVCLHASAVAIGTSSVALLGSSGAGKSTTAAGFVKRGFSLLSDDVTALSPAGGRFAVLPGHPRLNLWPDAGEALYGSAHRLPRVAPRGGIYDWWDKRYVDLEDRFQRTPLPLAAVYVLGERAADADVSRVEPMSATDAFMTLTDETYVNFALDESMRATEFQILGRLVRTTPVRLVVAHDNPARVLDLCGTILDDCKQLA